MKTANWFYRNFMHPDDRKERLERALRYANGQFNWYDSAMSFLGHTALAIVMVLVILAVAYAGNKYGW